MITLQDKSNQHCIQIPYLEEKKHGKYELE